MKRTRKNDLWYNPCDKEIGGILLEGREAVLRRGGLYPDVRTGPWPMGAHPDFRTTIL